MGKFVTVYVLAAVAIIAIVTGASALPEPPAVAPWSLSEVVEISMPTGAEIGPEITSERLAEALATPCAEEDSVDCYWIASERGNDIGTSFLNVAGHVFPLAEIRP